MATLTVNTTLANDAVTNAKLANMAAATVKGRRVSGAGDPEDLNADGVSEILDTATDPFVRTSNLPAASGDVVGPASATDNAITRFDQTTGKLIQNSTVILDDAGTITGVAALAATTASITSANAGTAVITTLTATGASIASVNAGVALLTTATVTTLTATGASVASANMGTLTVTNASATSANIVTLTATNASATSINDQYGYIRNVPQSGSNKTSTYTLSAGDTGRFIGVGTSGKIVIPNAVMATGQVVSLYNATTGNITVECSISIAYIAGTNTDKNSVTLATRGVATVLFLDSDNCVISGNVT